jgi:hypothetical protein
VLASKLRSAWTEEFMDRAVHVVHSEAGEGINYIMTGWITGDMEGDSARHTQKIEWHRRSSGPVQVSKRGEM